MANISVILKTTCTFVGSDGPVFETSVTILDYPIIPYKIATIYSIFLRLFTIELGEQRQEDRQTEVQCTMEWRSRNILDFKN